MKRDDKILVLAGGILRRLTPRAFHMLDGIILLDTLGNLDEYQSRIDERATLTGLPIL